MAIFTCAVQYILVLIYFIQGGLYPFIPKPHIAFPVHSPHW